MMLLSEKIARALHGLCALALITSCGSSTGTTGSTSDTDAPQGTASTEERFQRLAETFYRDHLEALPPLAVGLGFHEYDGKLPDLSRDSVAARIAMYREANQAFAAIPAAELSARSRVEREVLLTETRSWLFDLDVMTMHERNPMAYIFGIGLLGYIAYDYAPIEDRARAIIAICNGVGPYLAQGQKNLSEVIPRPWLQIAMLMTSGMIEFARNDAAKAMAGLDEPLASELRTALDTYATAVGGYHEFLKSRMATASDDFALGEELFLRMLRDKEGVEISLERLTAIGEADLQRNLAAAAAAARTIDPASDPRTVFDAVAGEKPTPDQVLATATDQSARLRQFLIDRDIVEIPSPDVAEVRASPPFMRFNSAFLNSAGLFEKKPLPSFYYISPPDPSWPEEQQRAYIPSYGNLFFTSVHELWPGHFLQHLHKKKNPSKILKTFCAYTNSEGWAHYTEEMMWLQKSAGDDARMHMGQLGDALLRNVRFKSAIALHTGGATVEQVKTWFLEQGYQDPGNAMQQAMRGTFDPGYLNYTLGKLMIMKLHDDWKARMGDRYSLRAFHDTFLSYGCAPVPVIRREMLGDDSPAL